MSASSTELTIPEIEAGRLLSPETEWVGEGYQCYLLGTSTLDRNCMYLRSYNPCCPHDQKDLLPPGAGIPFQ